VVVQRSSEVAPEGGGRGRVTEAKGGEEVELEGEPQEEGR
jgi:hypothetical protein